MLNLNRSKVSSMFAAGFFLVVGFSAAGCSGAGASKPSGKAWAEVGARGKADHVEEKKPDPSIKRGRGR